MSLEVAASLRGEAHSELWMALQRAESRETLVLSVPADYDALVARFACATDCGVATVVPAGQQVDKEYLDATGFRQPLLVQSSAQVDLVVPAPGTMTLKDLETAIGAEQSVRAIDVASQRELASEMKLKEWMQYFGRSPSQRDRVLNLISLECSGTKLDKLVRPPKVVREIGWVEKHWGLPMLGGKVAMARTERARSPKVRLYCLMSAAGSYTESHVDFGGSSVWYHLYKGRKAFVVDSDLNIVWPTVLFLVPPTETNLDKFATWEATYRHGNAPIFGDLVPEGECTVVEMRAGDTMLLPSGWIHAVYTPEDSISFGGNFLSGYHMATQLQCHGKEKRQQIESRFFFPEFECAVWYAAAYYAKIMETCPTVVTKWEWRDLPVLVDALRAWLVGDTHRVTGAPDPDILARVIWICKTAMRSSPLEVLNKMAKRLAEKEQVTASILPDDGQVEKASEEPVIMMTGGSKTTLDETTTPPSVIQAAPIDDPRDSISRIVTDDSSTSNSSSSDESSSDSSDASTPDSSDGEDTFKGNEDEPPAAGDDDNGETNESSSNSSSDDESSSSSGSDNEEEKPNESEDKNEPQKEEEPEEFDEPEESSSSDSDNDFDPESAYPDLPPVPIDALIAIRKRAKLKELQITKQGKEEVIAIARLHLMERQKNARSKKKSAKAGSNGGVPLAGIVLWGEDDHWEVACSCGLGGKDYDDGREMVECNHCKTWVHIGCVRVPIHDVFWCFKCRASDDWLFVCPCGIKTKNFDDGKRMVQCGVCETWQHTACGGIKDTDEPPEVYECTTCRKLRKKKKPSSASSRNSKKASKNKKTGKSRTASKSMQEVSSNGTDLISSVATAPPLPSSTTGASSPPPPPPPPPSAPPSPVPSHHEDHATSATNSVTPPDFLPHNPVQKRRRGRPPSGKSKEKKTKDYDEDYRESGKGSGSPTATHAASLMMRPPLPLTPKSAAASGKRKSGSSARDRLEKKLKTRKPRG